MAPYAPSRVVRICADGVCDESGTRFALKDIARATAELLKANGPGTIDICEADRSNRTCMRPHLSYTVHGPISAAGKVPSAALRAGADFDGDRTIHVRLNIPTFVMGQNTDCQDAQSTFKVRSARYMVWESGVYNCGWGGGPQNAAAEGRLGLDFIDFDQGIWGGEFTIRVSGGASGFQSGYALARFRSGMRQSGQVWLKPRPSRPSRPASPAVASVMDAGAYSNDLQDQIVSRKHLSPGMLGRYHALVIGNNRYHHLGRLKSAIHDAKAVAGLLRKRYGFRVELLTNADRSSMLAALEQMRRKLSSNDNLLIYYAGHGWLDPDSDEGFWLPVDARPDSQIQWISNATITGLLRAMQAKHVLIVADSCYSGKLTRGVHIGLRSSDYYKRISRKRARIAMTSGGLEPVLDSGGAGRHSVFTGAFLKALSDSNGVMDGARLFTTVRRRVMMDADQTPEYADIRKAGHDGGDFLFVPK